MTNRAAGGSLNGFRPAFDGSIGELTAVASAKRAVRGDFNEGGFTDNVDRDVACESPEADRSRTANCTSFF